MTTNYSALRKSGHLAGTIKRAAALSQQRRDARESSPTQPRLVAISLGPEHVRQTTDVAQVRYPRRENWAHPEPSTDIRLREIIVRTRDHGAYSRNAWYHRLSYVPTIRSCGVVTAGRADLVALARPHLTNPHFTLDASAQYGHTAQRWPLPYDAAKDQAMRLAQREKAEADDLRRAAAPSSHRGGGE